MAAPTGGVVASGPGAAQDGYMPPFRSTAVNNNPRNNARVNNRARPKRSGGQA